MPENDVKQILKSIEDLSMQVKQLSESNIRAESKYRECEDKFDKRYLQICNFKHHFYQAYETAKKETRGLWKFTLTIAQLTHVALMVWVLLRLI